MRGKYFDEFELGEELPVGSRTVTQTDIVNFAGISGDFNPLHMDHEFAKTTVHGEVIAHGALVFAMTSGLINAAGFTDGTNIAFLEMTQKFTKAVKIGDTITPIVSVYDKHLSRKKDRGVLTLQVLTKNQHGDVVIEGYWKLLMKCSRVMDEVTMPLEKE